MTPSPTDETLTMAAAPSRIRSRLRFAGLDLVEETKLMMGVEVSYSAALVAGLLSFASPCVLPLVPAYLGFIGGVTLHELADEAEPNWARTTHVFLSALCFVLGFSVIFVAMGATASAIGALVTRHLFFLNVMAGTVIIIFGLHFMDVLRIPYLYREARLHIENKPAGLFGAFVIGLAFAFGWTPCVGPVLSSILFLAMEENSVAQGATLLGIYAAGLGIPFLLAALLARAFLGFMAGIRQYMHRMEMIIGVLLVITGVGILTGTLGIVNHWLYNNLSIFQNMG